VPDFVITPRFDTQQHRVLFYSNIYAGAHFLTNRFFASDVAEVVEICVWELDFLRLSPMRPRRSTYSNIH